MRNSVMNYQIYNNDFEPENTSRNTISCQKRVQEINTISCQEKNGDKTYAFVLEK